MDPDALEKRRKELRDFVQGRISARKQTDFRTYISNLYARIATEPEYRDLPKIQEQDEVFGTYLTFVACLNTGRLCLSLPIRVPRKMRSTRYYLDQTLVQYCGGWLPIDTFIHAVVTAPYLCNPTGDGGYERMWTWYKDNKKTFRFLDLPKELRLPIYEYAVGDEVYPAVKDAAQGIVSLGRGWVPRAPHPCLERTHDKADEVAPPNTALMCLNKKIRDEVQSIVWGSTWQSFQDSATLRYFVDNRFLLPPGTLKHIGLNFDNYTYFQFFGAQIFPLNIAPTLTIGARILQKATLPNLERLDIKFRSPCWEPLTSPWSMALDNQLRLAGQMNTRAWARDYACQTMVTTMILTLAMEHIQHIKYVHVEGYVKNSIKLDFYEAMKALRATPKEATGWKLTKNDVMDWSRFNMPPRCQCRAKCGFWGVKVLFDLSRPVRERGRPSEKAEKIFSKYKFDYDD